MFKLVKFDQERFAVMTAGVTEVGTAQEIAEYLRASRVSERDIAESFFDLTLGGKLVADFGVNRTFIYSM